MIFVTVGSDLPFDRLVRHVDTWAAKHRRTDVFAQIGRTEYRPANIGFSKFLEPPEFSHRMACASALVAHAGMGTILSALRLQKPIIVFPRRTEFREVRNEHQLSTARYLSKTGKIRVALDEEELLQQLDRIDSLRPSAHISEFANEELLDFIRSFVVPRDTSPQ